MLNKYRDYNFIKKYITVTYKQELHKICHPIQGDKTEDIFKYIKDLINLITNIDRYNILEINIVEGQSIKNDKVSYIYESREDFIEQISLICSSIKEDLQETNDIVKIINELFNEADVKQRNIDRIPKIIHLLESYWMMDKNHQLRFFQLLNNIMYKINSNSNNIEDFYNIEDDKTFEEIFKLYKDEYNSKFKSKIKLVNSIDIWTNKPQKLQQIWNLYNSLTYEEIIEGIKDIDEKDIKIGLYIKLLRQHIKDNHLEIDDDIVVGQDEYGRDIIVPDDYELQVINEINLKDKLSYISFEQFKKELNSHEWRKKRGRKFIK